MKVKQNGQWKNLGGIDVGKFGNYTLLTPEMVSGTLGGSGQRYIGTATHLIIDDSFPTNNLNSLFRDNQTLKSLVILTNKFTITSSIFRDIGNQFDFFFIDTSNVTSMDYMFMNSKATSLDLSSFDTSNVTKMNIMFSGSQATNLDLSSFDTSNVTNMSAMFGASQATSLDLSSFDTSNVTNMSAMFNGSQATTLDLSSFDTTNVTNTTSMFYNSKATIGYARTQADADRFNASLGKPEGLVFVVKGT